MPGACRTRTASVCPRFCSSRHSRVCRHTVPSAEQTAHGESQQLAGRDSTGCVPRPASPAPPTAGFAIKTRIQFELGGCRVRDTGKPQLPEQKGCCGAQEGFTSLLSGVNRPALSCRCCHPHMMVVGMTQEFLHGKGNLPWLGGCREQGSEQVSP